MSNEAAVKRSEQPDPETPVSGVPSFSWEHPRSLDKPAPEKKMTTLEVLGLRTLADFIKVARQGDDEANYR